MKFQLTVEIDYITEEPENKTSVRNLIKETQTEKLLNSKIQTKIINLLKKSNSKFCKIRFPDSIHIKQTKNYFD